jgi:hypothetical protein
MLRQWRRDKAPRQCTREQLLLEFRRGRLVDDIPNPGDGG